ncbi:hypothetical protein PHISP_03373 [Aspergillus sp. HF37]|nr:hypothetical protein PHISP_03373 [Aspergillus sp. HF37]
MAQLHDALQSLAPTTWDNIPHASQPALRDYIADLARSATLIANSLPAPPCADSQTPALDPSSHPSSQITTTAPPRPNPTDPTLQDQWGKPLKTAPKDNPLHISAYKLSSADGKGAWFGRRSVHAGLGFAEWKEKLKGEFAECLRVNQRLGEEGRTPNFAVRGIGAESVAEDLDVPADATAEEGKGGQEGNGGQVVANVQVVCATGIFPKPTTPRDFSALVVTCEVDESGGLVGDGDTATKDGPRCWMVVSKPCVHDQIPQRDGYIRGQYESVELIREVATATGTGNEHDGQQTSTADADADADADASPVEWIMVSRSDPGGNIPRWMVEKGTPRSICADTVKFLDWACRDVGGAAQEKGPGDVQPDGTIHGAQGDEGDLDESASESDDLESEERSGLIASAGYMLNAGLGRFVPQGVRDYLPSYTHGYTRSAPEDISVPATDSETEARNAAAPETEKTNEEKPPAPDKASLSDSANSGFATPLLDSTENVAAVQEGKKGKLSSHEKELIKLAQKKSKSETKLDSVRSEMASLHLSPGSSSNRTSRHQADSECASNAPSTATSRSQSRTANAETAQKHKAASGLSQTESKLLKELAKIEKSQLKAAGKLEDRQRKAAAKKSKSQSRSDVDGLRREVDGLKREVESLRDERQQWLGLVKSLQDENAKLAARTGDEGK